jgi:hypothetical protein
MHALCSNLSCCMEVISELGMLWHYGTLTMKSQSDLPCTPVPLLTDP